MNNLTLMNRCMALGCCLVVPVLSQPTLAQEKQSTDIVPDTKQDDAVAFPGTLPLEKPTDRPLSSAMQRAYDFWGIQTLGSPHGVSQNDQSELYSNFLYSRLQGFDYSHNTSRRDPTKVLKIDGTYYVWYTHRKTVAPPSGAAKATDVIPSADWDLADIWYATSQDGFTWQEQGVAVARPPKPNYGWRSVTTPDILAFKGKYYLYYQGFNAIPFSEGGDIAAVTVAEADSPRGPWRQLGRVVVDFGRADEWDAGAIHDPLPIVYRGKIYLYYKGQPLPGQGESSGVKLLRAQGVAIAENPLGPFTKHPLNPVVNSGHETCMFPWKGGIAAITSLDGPEKNTVQFASDGVNFEIMSSIEMPPLAPGPFMPDAFADNSDGRGITWGLCHIPPPSHATGARNWTDNAHYSLARFDCDLSRDVHRAELKRTYPGRYDEAAFFSSRAELPGWLLNRVKKEEQQLDQDTILERE